MKNYERVVKGDVITVTRDKQGEVTTECYVAADTEMEGALTTCRILMCAAVSVASKIGISEEDMNRIFDNTCEQFYGGDDEDGD